MIPHESMTGESEPTDDSTRHNEGDTEKEVLASSSSPQREDLSSVPVPEYDDRCQNAIEKIAKGDIPVWNILPSYHMYTSTVSKSLAVGNDDQSFEPPTYDDLSTTSSNGIVAGSTFTLSAHTSNVENSTTPGTPNPNLIVADEGSNSWENTILDNIHTLTNLSDSDNPIAKALKIEIYFTEDVGESGMKPTIIDPSNFEYKQGDLINGYIKVQNTSSEEIPFDMFYVLFEGVFKIRGTPNANNPEGDLVIKKFLEMFDFSASWHYGYINRLVSEFTKPNQYPEYVDPIDDTHYSFGFERTVKPFITHKRFFTFKIPDKLLDSTCQHSLSSHIEIPPSIGNSSGKLNLTNMGDSEVRDFAFIDTSISYRVHARFIGKASQYGVLPVKKPVEATLVDSAGDEYLILKDTHQMIRIIEEKNKLTSLETRANRESIKLFYDNFVARIDEIIEFGKNILSSRSISPVSSREQSNILGAIISPRGDLVEPELSTTISANSTMDRELAKCRQLYKPVNGGGKSKSSMALGLDNDVYKIFYPIQKKTLTGATKFLGTMVITTPKIHYKIKYIPPSHFHAEEPDTSSWILNVPINIEYVLSSSANSSRKGVKLPEIKSIAMELISLTIKSNGECIPVEFNHGMIFNNSHQQFKKLIFETNYFEETVVKPMLQKAKEVQNLSSKLGSQLFRMDANLSRDLKNICRLKTKNMNLAVEDVKIRDNNSTASTSKNSASWIIKDKQTNSDAPTTYKMDLTAVCDLTTARVKSAESPVNTKAYDNFNLVPDFQMCQMARFYYLKIFITLSKGEIILLNVPVEVQK
ncbi:hypothetical protein CAAN1_13S01970 [[Candida] anglica]|uniref:Bul1 N-terminal domain-containing protein n=1 Tax=[Candida] anglica TaxID=148631 RepID=A0ABP0EG44_9ASCO